MLNKIKLLLENKDIENKKLSDGETNPYFYINLMAEYFKEKPTQTYFPQALILNDIFKDLSILEAYQVIDKFNKETNNEIIYLIHEYNTYDCCDHELTLKVHPEEFINAIKDSSYIPADMNSGHDIPDYDPKLLSFVFFIKR